MLFRSKEEVEQIDELSIGKLKQIHHAAVQSANIHDREGDTEKANKRYDLAGKASMKAQDKLKAAQAAQKEEKVSSLSKIKKQIGMKEAKDPSMDAGVGSEANQAQNANTTSDPDLNKKKD